MIATIHTDHMAIRPSSVDTYSQILLQPLILSQLLIVRRLLGFHGSILPMKRKNISFSSPSRLVSLSSNGTLALEYQHRTFLQKPLMISVGCDNEAENARETECKAR